MCSFIKNNNIFKLSKIEKSILDWIKKNNLIIFTIFIIIIALYARLKLYDFYTPDYNGIEIWFNHFKNNGGLLALNNPIGDYNTPYLILLSLLSYLPFKQIYIVKIMLTIFDIFLAISASMLTYEIMKSNKNHKYYSLLTFMIVFISPLVIFNSAFWGQCDALYSAFALLSIYFLLKNKFTLAFLFLGISLAFKLQAIFILPVFIILYFEKRKFSVLNFILLLIPNLILSLPALILGMPINYWLKIYFNQIESYQMLTLNFINIYKLFPNYSDYLRDFGIIFALLICFIVLFVILNKKINWNKEKIISLTLWFTIVLTYVLPSMHERYLFLGEVLAISYYICHKKNLFILIFIIINSFITYTNYLTNSIVSINIVFLSLLYLVSIVYFSKNIFFNIIEEDNS
ncbi:MAG: hypothetical protein PHD03_04210 [Bacilli bacterium]|nr:hypothetical protein [Bacilli bacterium]